jgi:DNA-binding transcriptional LysR family regulator
VTIKSKFSDSKSNQFDWDRLKVFFALAHSGTLEKTHELTGIPVSSISHHIKELEKDLGVTLINRNKGVQGNILTDAGQVFYKATSDVYKRFDEAISELENKEEISGKITIATAKGFGVSWLMPKLIKFNEIYKDVVFDIVLVDIFQNLINYDADLYISPKLGEASNLIHDHLAQFEYRVYTSKKYIEKNGVPRTIEDLNQHKIISWKQRSLSPQFNWLLIAGMQQGLEREPALILDDANLILDAIENGLGIALLVQYVELYRPNLVRILANYNIGTLDLYLIISSETEKLRKINLLVTYLKDSAH